MLKQHKRMLILTSILILLPMAAGLILWPKLPSSIATHFNVNNEPDGWSSKAFTVFGMPLILLGLHALAVFCTLRDPKGSGIPWKMLRILLWICPWCSILAGAITYGYAMGIWVDIGQIVILCMGLLLIAMGNELPKCQPNYTVGIRIPWTLADPENWRKSHRFGGWTMTIGGLLCLVTAFLESPWVFFVILAAAVLLPCVYSYVYDRPHHREGGKS